MADALRYRRTLGLVTACAIAANIAGATAFLLMNDLVDAMPRVAALPLSFAMPAALAVVSAGAGYEALIRVLLLARVQERLQGPAVRSSHVPRRNQAFVMVVASMIAGAMLGVIYESANPPEAVTLFLSAIVGAFWGFLLGLASSSIVWFFARRGR